MLLKAKIMLSSESKTYQGNLYPEYVHSHLAFISFEIIKPAQHNRNDFACLQHLSLYFHLSKASTILLIISCNEFQHLLFAELELTSLLITKQKTKKNRYLPSMVFIRITVLCGYLISHN